MPILNIRGIARQFMGEAVSAGLNTVQFEGMIRAAYGTFYRRQNFLADWREMTGRERKRDPLKSIRKDRRPTESVIQESEYEQAAKFHYHFKIHGYDSLTGETAVQHFTVASDTVLTMGEAEEEVDRLRDVYFPEIAVTSIERDYVAVKR